MISLLPLVELRCDVSRLSEISILLMMSQFALRPLMPSLPSCHADAALLHAGGVFLIPSQHPHHFLSQLSHYMMLQLARKSSCKEQPTVPNLAYEWRKTLGDRPPNSDLNGYLRLQGITPLHKVGYFSARSLYRSKCEGHSPLLSSISVPTPLDFHYLFVYLSVLLF